MAVSVVCPNLVLDNHGFATVGDKQVDVVNLALDSSARKLKVRRASDVSQELFEIVALPLNGLT